MDMKKVLAIATMIGVLVLPAFALADSIAPGVQTQGGTITAWAVSYGNNAGRDYSWLSSSNLSINGTVVDSSSGNGVPGSGSGYGNSGLSISFNAGDDLEVNCSATGYGEYCNPPYSITGSYTTSVCSPSTISNGTIGSYPTCAVSCNGGYTLTGGACVANSGGGSTGSAITMPTSTASSLTATIGHQLTDPGTLLVIGLVAGIPLTFYVMEQLIALLPGNSNYRWK